MLIRHLIWLRVLALVVIVMFSSVFPRAAMADLLLGSFGTINWDRSVDATSSPLITIPITNNNLASTDTIAGWALRLVTVSTAGTVDADFQLASATFPANHVLSAPDALSTTGSSADLLLAGTTDLDGVGNFPDGADAGADPDFDSVPASGKALVQFRLTTASGAGASGIYQIVAQNNAVGTQSYWTNQEFSDLSFGNLPASAGSSVVLGTVNISAVPEPGSAQLVGLCCAVSLSGLAVRRRWTTRRQVA